MRSLLFSISWQFGRLKLAALGLQARRLGVHLGCRDAMQRGMGPLVVTRGRPAGAPQRCAALFPGEQIDLYDCVGEAAHVAWVGPADGGSLHEPFVSSLGALRRAVTALEA